jgi:hypothetical protein
MTELTHFVLLMLAMHPKIQVSKIIIQRIYMLRVYTLLFAQIIVLSASHSIITTILVTIILVS